MSRSSALAMCITLCPLVPAQAAIIIVTSDSGGTGGPDCTLRDAITAANTDTPTGGCPAGSGADTIELPADATIMLTEEDNNTDGHNGLPSITSEITIYGNLTTVRRDAGDDTPEFRILLVAAAGNLTLNELTVSHGSGNLGGTYGAGIRNYGTLMLIDSIVSENSGGSNGGGIRNDGTLMLIDSIVSGNWAGVGAGIIHKGSTLTLTRTTVSGNTASSAGGIYIPSSNVSSVTITDSNIKGNTTTGNSAGVYNGGGTMTITNSIVSGNSAGTYGGGLSNHVGGNLVLIDTTVTGNTAGGNGGGILSGEGMLTLSGSVVNGNTAGVFGGGIRIYEGGAVTLTHSIVNGNSAMADGGGIFSTGEMALSDATICGNTPNQINGSYKDGGGNFIADECPACVAADFDYDGTVSAADLAELLGSWGPCPEPCVPGDRADTCPADLDGDCDVGASDLAQLLGSWGPCPQ